MISIIIPVFNRVKYTLKCLEAIAANTEGVDFELVIVDNASSDETPQLLKALTGDVHTIRNQENLGFATACNQGAEAAGGDLLLFLNNDTEPRPNWLPPIIRAMADSPDTAIVGNKLIFPKNDSIQHAGVVFRPNGVPYHIFQGLPAMHPATNTMERFQAVTAACMMVRKEVFAGLQGFDQAYINGYEDIDFCLKTGRAGYGIVYTPHSQVLHHEGISQGRKAHDVRNMELFVSRWGDQVRHDENEHYARLGLQLIYHDDGQTCTVHYPNSPHWDHTFDINAQSANFRVPEPA